MKSIRKCSPISLIILLFSFSSEAQDGRDTKKINVGDKAPEISAFKWIKGTPVNDFKKGRIYVIEFGATWCAPCRAAVPTLTSLAEKYKNSISVVSFFVLEFNNEPLETKNPRYVTNVENYVTMQSKKMRYTVAVDDPQQTMHTRWLSGREGVPHIYVIDGNGQIAWIGSNPQILDSIIEIVSNADYNILTMTSKEHIEKKSTDFFSIINSHPQHIAFLSALGQYQQGQQETLGIASTAYIPSYSWAKAGSEESKKQGKIEVVGETLRRLYYMAYADTLWNYPLMPNPKTGIYPDTLKYPHLRRSYGKYWYCPILEISDSSLFEADYRHPRNRFNYYLQVPPELGSAFFMQQALQKDLALYFGYNVTLETRLMPYWKLTINDEAKSNIIAKDRGEGYKWYADSEGNYLYKNGEVRDLIFQLEIKYGYGGEGNLVYHPDLQPPFIDETGITEKIDYTFPAPFAKKILAARDEGKEFPFEEYCEMLKAMGFQLTKGMREMKVVVIRDPITRVQESY